MLSLEAAATVWDRTRSSREDGLRGGRNIHLMGHSSGENLTSTIPVLSMFHCKPYSRAKIFAAASALSTDKLIWYLNKSDQH
jgi:hypothetical protein